MERRLRRDPHIRTPCGRFRLLEHTCVRPAAQGLARRGVQAEALAGATRACGGHRGRRESDFCLVLERSPADASGRTTTGSPVST
eukprot:13671286-Alexandrium_andersonii.AAC.1